MRSLQTILSVFHFAIQSENFQPFSLDLTASVVTAFSLCRTVEMLSFTACFSLTQRHQSHFTKEENGPNIILSRKQLQRESESL